jgi:hypothetical protein
VDLQSPWQSRIEQLIASRLMVMAIAASLATWLAPSQPAGDVRFTYAGLTRYAVYTLVLAFLCHRKSNQPQCHPWCFIVRMCHPMLAMVREVPDSAGSPTTFISLDVYLANVWRDLDLELDYVGAYSQ